jgi:hypothetical protein
VRDQIDFHQPGAHEVDAGEENAVNVEQWFHAARALFSEQFPLGFGEAKIMMRMVLGDDARQFVAGLLPPSREASRRAVV